MRPNKPFEWEVPQPAMLRMRTVALLMVGALATQSACAQVKGKPSEPAAGGSVAELDAELKNTTSAIQREVGDPVADDPSQCAVLPLGKKPCGGPSGYLVYSRRASDATRLQSLAERYAELQDARNKLTGAMSNCMMERIPDPIIVDGRCQASYDKYTPK